MKRTCPTRPKSSLAPARTCPTRPKSLTICFSDDERVSTIRIETDDQWLSIGATVTDLYRFLEAAPPGLVGLTRIGGRQLDNPATAGTVRGHDRCTGGT